MSPCKTSNWFCMETSLINNDNNSYWYYQLSKNCPIKTLETKRSITQLAKFFCEFYVVWSFLAIKLNHLILIKLKFWLILITECLIRYFGHLTFGMKRNKWKKKIDKWISNPLFCCYDVLTSLSYITTVILPIFSFKIGYSYV